MRASAVPTRLSAGHADAFAWPSEQVFSCGETAVAKPFGKPTSTFLLGVSSDAWVTIVVTAVGLLTVDGSIDTENFGAYAAEALPASARNDAATPEQAMAAVMRRFTRVPFPFSSMS